MAIDRLINSTQGDQIITALGGNQGADSIAASLATIAAKSNTPYNTDNKLHAQYTDLPGYVKESSSKSIQTTDTVTDAFGKLEYKVDKNISDINTNKNNILLNWCKGKNRYQITKEGLISANSGATVSGNVFTLNNITFTLNDDSSISVSAPSTHVVTTFYLNTICPITSNDIITGCPIGGSGTTYELRIYDETGNYQKSDYGEGATFTTSKNIKLGIMIRADVAANIVFKPMVCTQSEWSASHTYFPYAMSNVELTAKERVNENNILTVADQAVIYNYYRQTETVSQTGVTVNADSTITVNVNNTSDNWIALNLMDFAKVNIPDGDYYIYGCPPNGSQSTYRLDITRTSPPALPEYGEGTEFNKNSTNPPIYFRLVIGPNTNVQNKTFKPMFIPKSVWDAGFRSYQPYALSNVELAAKEQLNENNILFNAQQGVTNVATVTSGTYTATSGMRYISIPLSTTLTGDITVVIGGLSSTATGTQCAVQLTDATTTLWQTTATRGSNIVLSAHIDSPATKLNIYCGASYQTTSAGDTVTWTDLMVCPTSLYTGTYQPYALSNVELTPIVQAKQHNFSAANTLEDTGLSFTVNIGTYLLTSSISWDSGEPLALILSSSADVSSVTRYTTYAGIEVENTQGQTLQTISALVNVTQTPVTLKVFAKNAVATGRSKVVLSAQKLS